MVVHVDQTTVSDGKTNKHYFPTLDEMADSTDNDETTMIYNYHSDRPDAPKLLVSVYHGKVIQVDGGAEETTDIPYSLPGQSPPAPDSDQPENPSWRQWISDLLFKK